MSFLNRLSFASPLESRDGTLARDSKMKNCVIENVDGQKLVVKRPGVANGSTIIGGGIAQGMTALNGVVYSVVSDQLYALPVSPWSGTGGGGGPVISGAGGGGSGWQLQTVKLPCNATRGDQFFVM